MFPDVGTVVARRVVVTGATVVAVVVSGDFESDPHAPNSTPTAAAITPTHRHRILRWCQETAAGAGYSERWPRRP